MDQFVAATRMSVSSGNWYGALSLALTMPDICGRLEAPGLGSKARTIAWFDRYLADKYRAKVGPRREDHTFMKGGDFYALRCAYLHEGGFDASDHSARDVLDRFRFMENLAGGIAHCNQRGRQLQLQVSVLCEQVCVGVESWVVDMRGQPEVEARIRDLAVIELIRPGDIVRLP